MKLLVLGGTKFLGRHLVDAALGRGDEVTLFHRGETNPGLFPDVESLIGDRDGGLAPLEGRRWDAVVDTCGYVPRVVRASAELLRDAVDRYLFVSSISVQRSHAEAGQNEDSPLAELEDEAVEEVTGETYGGLKVLCERAVEEVFGLRSFVVRPGLIVGPHDPTGRFTYWPRRVAAGGEVLVFEDFEAPVQFVDARDLAAWMLTCLDEERSGILQATGPEATLPWGEFLERTRVALASDAEWVPVSDAFLEEQEVAPWTGLPFWIPGQSHAGFQRADCSRAIAAGLRFRPLEETVRDVHAWDATRSVEERGADARMPGQCAISGEREAELLSAWRSRQDA